jgi:lysophospholipase L1-like esterase
MRKFSKRLLSMMLIMMLALTLTVAEQPQQVQAATSAQKTKKAAKMTGKKAVFIGDSIMEGVSMFSGHSSNFVTKVGLNVTNAQSDSYKINGKTVVQWAKSYKPSYIYIMLGANEVGWMNNTTAKKNYISLINKLQKACPKAKIYVISIEPVQQKFLSSHSGYTMAKIAAYNKMLRTVAKSTKSTYISVYNYFKDSNGYLSSKYTWVNGDGLHWNTTGCKRFINAIKKELKKRM